MNLYPQVFGMNNVSVLQETILVDVQSPIGGFSVTIPAQVIVNTSAVFVVRLDSSSEYKLLFFLVFEVCCTGWHMRHSKQVERLRCVRRIFVGDRADFKNFVTPTTR